jgi:ATP-binding cassette subfamily B protein
VNLAPFVRTLPSGWNILSMSAERRCRQASGSFSHLPRAGARSKILILDEATSSVDTETELQIRKAIDRLMEGRTSIIIAHRLSTIQRCDKIIVMHKGRIARIGTHQQLLAQRGIYYKLYQLQYKDQEVAVPGD